MPEITIYHNPRCATSRKALELLRKRGIEPRIVEYLKTPPSATELKRLLKLMGLAPRQLLRKKEAKETGLDKPSLTEEQIVAGMAKHPIVIERPIVVTRDRAALGRPPEAVLKIFDKSGAMALSLSLRDAIPPPPRAFGSRGASRCPI